MVVMLACSSSPSRSIRAGAFRADPQAAGVDQRGAGLDGRGHHFLQVHAAAAQLKQRVVVAPLLILALGIVGVTNTLLQVSDFMFAVSIFTALLPSITWVSLRSVPSTA